MSSNKKTNTPRIPAKEFARVTANARLTGVTDEEEARRHLGHRAHYLFQGFPTNVDRRRGAIFMNTVASRPVYVAAGASRPHFA